MSAGRAHWSHLSYFPLNTRVSAGREQLVTLLLLSIHHPWISWKSTAGHTSVTIHSSPVDQLADHSWSQFCYSPLITRGSAGRVQLVTLLLLFTYHPWISWQSTADHTSVTLHLSPVDQMTDHSWSHFCYSPVIARVSAGRAHWSHFGYSPLTTRVSAGRIQLVTLLLFSSHHPWISWQSTAGHTSVTLHSSPVDQLAEHNWSHFDYSPLITRGSAGREQLLTLLLLSTHVTLQSSPVCQLAEHTGHTSVTLQSTPVCQLAENSWSHFCYSPFITRGSAGKAQLVTLLLQSTHHPWISWQITAGHTSVTLLSSPVDQLAEYSWSHFCYSPLITRGSAGRVQLVTLLLLSSHHPCVSWRSTLVTLRLLSIHHPCVRWQNTAGYISVTLQSSPVHRLEKHSWSDFCYSTLITRGSAGRVELVTLLSLYTHHTWISWQSRAGHTSVTLHSSPVDRLAKHSWSHFCYSTLFTRGSTGRAQLVTIRLLSTHHQWISWQSTAGHTSVTLQLSPVDQLTEHIWSHCCYSTVITRV